MKSFFTKAWLIIFLLPSLCPADYLLLSGGFYMDGLKYAGKIEQDKQHVHIFKEEGKETSFQINEQLIKLMTSNPPVLDGLTRLTVEDLPNYLSLAANRTKEQQRPQLETIKKEEKKQFIYHHGFYISGGYELATMKGKANGFIASRFGYSMNHQFHIGYLGFEGGPLFNDYTINDEEGELLYAQRGLEVGYTLNPHDVIKWTVQLAMGVGELSFHYGPKIWTGPSEGRGSLVRSHEIIDNIIFLEPMIFVEKNLSTWFRIGLGGGFRLVVMNDANIELGTNSWELSGINLELEFKLGRL